MNLKKNINGNKKKISTFRSICRGKVFDIGKCECGVKISCNHEHGSSRKGPQKSSGSLNVDSSEESEVEINDLDEESDYIVRNSENQIKLNLSAEIADRYQISDRAFGAIASGILTDVGIINVNNQNAVVNTGKTRHGNTLFQILKHRTTLMHNIHDRQKTPTCLTSPRTKNIYSTFVVPFQMVTATTE